MREHDLFHMRSKQNYLSDFAESYTEIVYAIANL